MPIELERPQDFPDGFTQVSDRWRKPAANTTRCKAIGNAMPVPPMRWIAARIEMLEMMDNPDK